MKKNIVSLEQLNEYREETTREIDMPDGTKRAVQMTTNLWADLDFLRVVENLLEPEIATFALEEMELQDATFNRAFRGVVAHFANRWT